VGGKDDFGIIGTRSTTFIPSFSSAATLSGLFVDSLTTSPFPLSPNQSL